MQKLTFGTDGVRGRVGEFPFTSTALRTIGSALGCWMIERYGVGRERVKILLAGDTRESVNDIKQYLFDQMVAFPIDIVDAGIIPTPAVLTLIKNDKTFSCGIVISASHNPYFDNGIKLFDAVVGKLSAQDEIRIGELFSYYAQLQDTGSKKAIGTINAWPGAAQAYVDCILAVVRPMAGKGLKVVLDCAHGATYQAAPTVFRAIGAEVIVLHDAPNGTNINDHSGAVHPEALQKAVVAHKADIGFAFDGDGDRIVMVNARGEVKDGDDVLAVLLDLEEYAQEPAVVGTVMSNSGFETYLKVKSKPLVRAAVGDKYVVAKLDELGLLLGGEPSGHIVLKNYLSSGDGILVAAKILEALQKSGRWQLDHITKFPQLTINVPVQAKRDLKEEPCAGILKMYDKIMQNGRILVRYSGTEPLLRIMVEAQDEQTTKKIAQQLANDLQQALSL